MISTKKTAGIVITLMILLSVCYILSSKRELPIRAGTDRWFYGRIEQGRKFGIEVGKPLRLGKGGLNTSSMKFVSNGDCSGTFRVLSGCKKLYNYKYYEIREFLYYGQLFIEYDEDRIVRSITWNADIFPLDWTV